VSEITTAEDPERFVRENKEQLREIIRHGDDQWIRAACIALLVEYGEDPSLDQLRREIESAREVLG